MTWDKGHKEQLENIVYGHISSWKFPNTIQSFTICLVFTSR